MNTLLNNTNNITMNKKRSRKPLTPEEKNICVDKNSVVLTESLKEELEKKRQYHNDKNKEYYERNKEKIITMAKERYYKTKESSSDTSSNSSTSNSDNNEKRQRGRPKGATGTKNKTLYSTLGEDTVKEIRDMQKLVNMLSKVGGDTTEYVNKIDDLKKKNIIVNDDKENEKITRTKPINEINFIPYLNTKTKREFSKQI